nr:Px [Coyote tobacco stunting virus]
MGCITSKDVSHRDYSDDSSSVPSAMVVPNVNFDREPRLVLDMPSDVHDRARVLSASLKVLSVLSENQSDPRASGGRDVRAHRTPPTRPFKRYIRGRSLQG